MISLFRKRPAFIPGFLSCFLFMCATVSFAEDTASEIIRTDVVVVSATPGGVATAVAAARSGCHVILIEESEHVGGIISGGLTNADILTRDAIRGVFEEYLQRICTFYRETYGADSIEYRECRQGYHVQPKVAEQVFRDMLAGEKQITLLEKHRVLSATVKGADGKERPAVPGKRMDGPMPENFSLPVKLTAITVADLNEIDKTKEIRAGVFVDAGYEGDFAAMAGVPYRVGRESRETFQESLAGKVYLRFWHHPDELQPGSTGAADDGIQAFCFRFHMTSDPENSVPVQKPEHYCREDYRPLLDDIKRCDDLMFQDVIQISPMPGGNYEINSNHPHPDRGVPSESLDLAEENWTWPEASREEREQIFNRYWSYNEGLIWFLQNDLEVPERIRLEAQKYAFPKNEFEDHQHRPHHLYVRQGRRIWGEYNLTENDACLGSTVARRHPQGIAVAEYPIDSHAVSKYDPEHPGVREGYVYVPHAPTQIPFGVLVPKSVDGLLVPVACSTSHIGYQMIRVEPTFMALGEAAGIAASESLRQKKELREIDVVPVQQELLNRGGVILFENDKPVDPFKE